MKEWHSDRVMELLKENLILKESLQKRETFIRRTFGRYLTDEVLEELLNDSNGLRIGGERREVTILISDIRQSIVAVFGAPKPNKLSARDATACAVAMQRRMKAVNEWNLSQEYPEISMGIGIHTGEAILGNIGSMTRAKYDMIGRDVNLTSRIQGFTKAGQILVSDETLNAAGSLVVENEAGAMLVSPKGIQNDVLLHDIVGFGNKLL